MNVAAVTLFGISLGNIILWLVFGLIVGFVVNLFDPADMRGGAVSAMVLGILGAIIGGVLSSILFGVGFIGFSLPGFITAVAGGLILAYLSRFIFRGTGEGVFQPGSSRYAYVGTKGGQARTGKEELFHHSPSDGHKIVNPVQVEKYLRHVDYPANKEELLTAAQAEGANVDVLHTLAEIPGEKFEGPTGVSKAVGKIK